MDSLHRCGECGKSPDETKFRLNGSNVLRKYCNDCENSRARRLRNAPEPTTTALVPTRTEHASFEGRSVPAVWVDWQRYWPVKPAVEAAGLDWSAQYRRVQRDARLARSIATIAIETAAGARDTACLPWESWHFFWVGVTDDVNEAARPTVERIKDEAYAALAAVFGDGPKTAAITTARTPDAIEQIKEGLVTLFAPALQQVITLAVDQAIEARGLGIVPQQTTEMADTLRGVTVIEREREVIRVEEWVADGWCYLFVNRRAGRMAIGETGSTPEQRIRQDAYNGGKDGSAAWEVAHAIQTDARKRVEDRLIRLASKAGAAPIPGTRGTFILNERVIADFCRLPRRLPAALLGGYVDGGMLFALPMFGGAL